MWPRLPGSAVTLQGRLSGDSDAFDVSLMQVGFLGFSYSELHQFTNLLQECLTEKLGASRNCRKGVSFGAASVWLPSVWHITLAIVPHMNLYMTIGV